MRPFPAWMTMSEGVRYLAAVEQRPKVWEWFYISYAYAVIPAKVLGVSGDGLVMKFKRSWLEDKCVRVIPTKDVLCRVPKPWWAFWQ